MRNLENHLRKCLHYKRRADTLERNNTYNSEDDVGTSVLQQSGTAGSSSGCSSTSTCGVKRAASSTLTSNHLKTMKIDQFVDRKFTRPQSKIVLQRMVEMIADNGMPFSWVEQPSTRQFFEAVRPAVVDIMPSAKALSGKLLKDAALRSREEKLVAMRKMASLGSTVVLVCDGWMDISKNHILGCILKVGGEWFSYDEALGRGNGNIMAGD